MKPERAWATIDLDVIANNLKLLRQRLPDKKFLAVVKADAYGHGSIPVSKRLEQENIDFLGVGTCREALDLRESGITTRILVLGALVEPELDLLIDQEISVTIHSPGRIEVLGKTALTMGRELGVHLLVDTGMSRLGVSPAQAVAHARNIAHCEGLRFEGIGTHLPTPSDSSEVFRQREILHEIVKDLENLRIRPLLVHIDASEAALRYPDPDAEMVRIGGALYGFFNHLPGGAGLEAALSLHSQIVYLRDHPADHPVGYNATYTTTRKSRLATVPIGYHDGFPSTLSNRGQVIIRGQRVPVVGRVTMDYTVIDVTDVPGTVVGDEVTLIGSDRNERIEAEEISRWCGILPYEVTCLLGRRINRHHVATISRELELEGR
ncbi:MAG: alanine racemase [Planctomycetota bacterium]